jgi:DUF4097 and DUF4098 domain-containing protein YvlB
MRKLATILLATLLSLPAAAAVVEIDRTLAIEPGGEVSIEIISGKVTVRGGGGNEVRVTGSYDEAYYDFELDADGEEVSIEVEPIRNQKGKKVSQVILEIELPAGVSLEFESISADLTVSDVSGELEIESVSGEVDVTGGDLDLSVSTVSGGIFVSASGALRSGEFESVSGDIRVRGDLAPGGRYSFEAVSGSLTLAVPAGSSARFDVESFSGGITNELSDDRPRKTSEYIPARELSFSIGGGDARVSMESLSGSIKLLRD